MILVYCLTIPEHIENIKILHMRTQKMNVDFILLGSILTKRNYDSNILRYQKNIFKNFNGSGSYSYAQSYFRLD